MMKRRIIYSLLAFLFLLACVSCGGVTNEVPKKNDDKKENNEIKSDVSFESFSPRSISVKNETEERLIAFKGRIDASSLISGVPSYASNHGLKMDETLFSKTEDFALLFLTEKVYNENKNNLKALQNSPFASVYAYYSKTGANDTIFKINRKSSGNLKITLNNNSPVYVEVFLDPTYSDAFCVVPPHIENFSVNIERGDYTFYPRFTKYSSRTGELYTFIPKFKSSNKPYFMELGIQDSSAVWNVGTFWNSQDYNLSTNGCWLKVNNQASTSVQLKMGDKKFTTSNGTSGIRQGKAETFFIQFPMNADHSPTDVFKISTLKIGTALYEGVALPEHIYKLDTQYEITVTGNREDLKISPIKEGSKLTTDEIVKILFDGV